MYTVYTLGIQSDRDLPGVQPANDETADVRVEWSAPFPSADLAAQFLPFYSDPVLDAGGRPVLVVRRHPAIGDFHFLYADGPEFLVSSDGTRVTSFARGESFESACVYLLGPIVGFLLRLRGHLCLHAAVIQAFDNASCFALVGPSGAGKSTWAASFARAGHVVLADDIAVLVEHGSQFHCQFSRLGFKLWADSASAVVGEIDHLPELLPDYRKRILNNESGAKDDPVVLQGIYLLEPRTSDARSPHIDGIDAMSAMLSLASHTYMNYLLTPELRKLEFETLQRLLKSAFVRRLVPRNDFAALPQTRELLCQDFAVHRQQDVSS